MAMFRQAAGDARTLLGLKVAQIKDLLDPADKVRLAMAAANVEMRRETEDLLSPLLKTVEAMGAFFGWELDDIKGFPVEDRLRVVTAGSYVTKGEKGGLPTFQKTLESLDGYFEWTLEMIAEFDTPHQIRLLTAAAQVAMGRAEGSAAFQKVLGSLDGLFGLALEQ